MSDHVGHEEQFAWMEEFVDFDSTPITGFDWAAGVFDDAEAAQESLLPKTSNPLAPSPAPGPVPSVLPESPWSSNGATIPFTGPCNQMNSNSDEDVEDSSLSTTALEPVALATVAHPDGEASSPSLEANKAPRKVKPTLMCHEEGCRHPGPFKREWELKRHVVAKHKGQKPFCCPYPGCFKGNTVSAFARPDKLTAHIRAVHPFDGPARCPEPACNSTLLPIDLLGIHIREAHLQHNQQALLNAGDTFYKSCPYWRCTTKVTLDTLIEHLLTHTSEEINYMNAELRKDGYTVVRQDCTHASMPPRGCSGTNSVEDSWGDSVCSCPIIGVHIVCPLCSHLLEGHNAFAKHLVEEHLCSDTQAARQYLKGRVRYITERKERYWGFSDMMYHIVSRGEPCGSCRFKNVGSENLLHHSCWMKPRDELVAELRPVRREILRLYPRFRYFHFVFEDLF